MSRSMLSALVLVMAACGGDGAETTSTSTSTSTTTTTTTPAETSTTLAETTTTAGPSTVPAQSALELSGSGLAGFEISVATADELIPFLAERLGPPDRDEIVSGTVGACPSGSDRVVTWAFDLTLVFDSGVLHGYLWELESPPGATPAGIRIGDSVGLLLAGHPSVSIEETTLGWEFFSEDSLRGFVSGPENDDEVLAIGAADLCAFR